MSLEECGERLERPVNQSITCIRRTAQKGKQIEIIIILLIIIKTIIIFEYLIFFLFFLTIRIFRPSWRRELSEPGRVYLQCNVQGG